MKNSKLFILLCSSFMYGILFSSQVPKGIDLDQLGIDLDLLERKAMNNVMCKQREDYINYYNLHPNRDLKERCLNSPDQRCIETFYEYKKFGLLNKEKK